MTQRCISLSGPVFESSISSQASSRFINYVVQIQIQNAVPMTFLCQSKRQLCTCKHIQTHAQEDGHSQCSLFSVLFAGLCPFREGSVPGLLWDPLLRVALLDVDAVPLQEAICWRSSVETVTMHSSEGSEAADAHELFMRGPTLCRDFKDGVWAVKWMVDKNHLAKDGSDLLRLRPLELDDV